MRKTRRKKTPRQTLVKKLDKAFADYVKARDKRTCQWCGNSPQRPQCAHIYPRRHVRTRWEDYNAITLCAYCHRQWHSDPLAASEWFKLRFPKRWGHVMDEKGKPSIKMTVADLEDKLEEYDCES